MAAPSPLTPLLAVRRGLVRRCPLCGSRGIFASWFELEDRCPVCNFPTSRSEDQWIGALGINMMVTFAVLVGALAVGFTVTYPDPPVTPLVVIIGTIAVVVPVGFYPIARSLWSGIDLAMRPPDLDDDIDPDYLPPTGHNET